MRNRLLVAGLIAAVVSGSGCHRRWCRDTSDRSPPPSRLDSPTRPSGIPPTNVPVTPSNVPSLPPPEIPDTGRSSYRLGEPLRPAEAPKPADPPARELLLPEPMPGATPPARMPETRRWLGEPIRPDATTPDERVAEKPAESAASKPPAGLVRVAGRDGQATGRVPAGGELDWLTANGFRTVLVLHDPATDLTDLRTQAERRGLRLLAVPVDPADLATAYESFARAVLDRGGRPVYVADAEAARASAMWYTLFRKQELAGDDVARLRATALGAAPERATVWPAVQALVAKP